MTMMIMMMTMMIMMMRAQTHLLFLTFLLFEGLVDGCKYQVHLSQPASRERRTCVNSAALGHRRSIGSHSIASDQEGAIVADTSISTTAAGTHTRMYGHNNARCNSTHFGRVFFALHARLGSFLGRSAAAAAASTAAAATATADQTSGILLGGRFHGHLQSPLVLHFHRLLQRL
jgi:hypothetical protein